MAHLLRMVDRLGSRPSWPVPDNSRTYLRHLGRAIAHGLVVRTVGFCRVQVVRLRQGLSDPANLAHIRCQEAVEKASQSAGAIPSAFGTEPAEWTGARCRHRASEAPCAFGIRHRKRAFDRRTEEWLRLAQAV